MTISILFSGGLLCLGWEGLGPQEPNGSGNRGQSGSGVTTPTYIHLHPCGGLRVKYCSRRGISQFTSWYMCRWRKNKIAKLITFDWLMNAHFHFTILSPVCLFHLFKSRHLVHLYLWVAAEGFFKVSSPVWVSVHGPDLIIRYLASQVDAEKLHWLFCSVKKNPLWFIEINQILVSSCFFATFQWLFHS